MVRFRRILITLLLLRFLISDAQRERKVKKEVDHSADFQQQENKDDDLIKRDPPGRPHGGGDENEGDIQAGGGRGTPTEDTHEPGMPYNYAYQVQEKETQFSQKVDSDGEVVTGEYRVLLPDGRTQVVTYTADWKNGYNAKVRYEPTPLPPRPTLNENEGNVLPGGLDPKPTPRPQACPSGHFRRPGESRCRVFQRVVDSQEGLPQIPNEHEQNIQPGGYFPEVTTMRPCPYPNSAKTSGTSRCGGMNGEDGHQDQGGYVPMLTTPCPPSYMRYPGKGYSNCHKVLRKAAHVMTHEPRRETRAPFPSQTIPKPEVVEGFTGVTVPITHPPCPEGYFYSTFEGQCRPQRYPPKLREDKQKCIEERKDPRTCFPSLCFPGSSHPGCFRRRLKSTAAIPPVVDEGEEDIQGAGFTLPPPPLEDRKPTNLYGTPDMPFGVRLNRKFGYNF